MQQPTSPKGKGVSQHTQMTVGLLFGIIALGLIIYFVIGPTWNNITLTKEAILSYQGLLTNLNSKLSNLEKATVNYSAISNQIDLINEAIPNYSNVPLVMKILEKLATEVIEEGIKSNDGGSLLISDIRVEQMPNDTPVADQNNTATMEQNEVSIMVILTGDYQAIKDYIVKLKSLRHNFFIDKISFSVSQDNRRQFLESTINLTYYYYN